MDCPFFKFTLIDTKYHSPCMSIWGQFFNLLTINNMKQLLKSLLFSFILLISINTYSAEPCKGTTKKKEQCKKSATVGEYCRLHDPNALKCSFIKKNKERCAMVVSKKDELCHHHKR